MPRTVHASGAIKTILLHTPSEGSSMKHLGKFRPMGSGAGWICELARIFRCMRRKIRNRLLDESRGEVIVMMVIEDTKEC